VDTKHLLIAGAVLAASGSSFADPKFEYGKAEEVAKVQGVEWNAQVEAGVVFTTGNSETTTLTAGIKTARKTGKNKLAFDGTLTYARSALRVAEDLDGDGLIGPDDAINTVRSTTAENLAGKLRYDRFLTEFNSLFIAALGSRDIPAGKDLVVGGQLGYSRRLHKSDRAEAVGEFGYDFSYEDLTSGTTNEIHSARAFIGLKAQMTEGATLDSSIEALTNLNSYSLPTKDAGFAEDTRINVRAAISAKIGKNLAFQTSIEAKYDNRPAPLSIANLAPGYVPEASKLDTMMKASLIYTIF
jgi:putative salt-induced outer membrane protein YdiY